MRLLDGPLAATEVGDDYPGCLWLAFPTLARCDRSNCLALHIQTDEYWVKGPHACSWRRSFTSLNPPWAYDEPDDEEVERDYWTSERLT